MEIRFFINLFQEALQSFVNSLQDDWEEQLILFEFAANDSVNPSTGYTPFYMVYCKHPTRLVLHSITSNVPAAEDFVLQINNTITQARDCIRKAKL